MKYYLLIIFAVLLYSTGYSQTSNSIYTDNTGSARYSNIDGTPFLYKDFMEAEVIASSGEVYTEARVNFNAYTQQIEYYKDDKIKEMLQGSYLKVSFETEDGRQEFMRGLHPELGLDLVCVLYDGKIIDFAKTIKVNVQEFNTPNATVSKFVPSVDYYLIEEGRLTKIALKKKKIFGALKGNKAALEKYIAEKDLKLRKEKEVIELLSYYEVTN